jgi:hypothetical protein
MIISKNLKGEKRNNSNWDAYNDKILVHTCAIEEFKISKM